MKLFKFVFIQTRTTFKLYLAAIIMASAVYSKKLICLISSNMRNVKEQAFFVQDVHILLPSIPVTGSHITGWNVKDAKTLPMLNGFTLHHALHKILMNILTERCLKNLVKLITFYLSCNRIVQLEL